MWSSGKDKSFHHFQTFIKSFTMFIDRQCNYFKSTEYSILLPQPKVTCYTYLLRARIHFVFCVAETRV